MCDDFSIFNGSIFENLVLCDSQGLCRMCLAEIWIDHQLNRQCRGRVNAHLVGSRNVPKPTFFVWIWSVFGLNPGPG